MLRPDRVMEALAGATSVAPIPTVVPDPVEFQHATKTGFNTLWVVFVIMLVATGVFSFLSWRIPVSRRLYHVITTLITLTATLSYFAMATGDGVSYHCGRATDHHDQIPDTHHLVCRQVFWARYVDWAITTPLLLLDLALLAGIDGAHTLMAIVADLVMILTGLLAAFGKDRGHGSAQKWGWYTIGCIAYLFVIWHIGLHGGRVVKAKGKTVTRLFAGLAIFTFILWTAYPIVWGVADGARLTSVNKEILAYAVLDVLAKPVFGTWLLFAHRRVAETNVEVGGWWAEGLAVAAEGRIRVGEEEA